MPIQKMIMRYSNRKLYDRRHSRYITLSEVADSVRAGEDLKIVMKDSGEDVTLVTLAQAIAAEVSEGATCDVGILVSVLSSLKKPDVPHRPAQPSSPSPVPGSPSPIPGAKF